MVASEATWRAKPTRTTHLPYCLPFIGQEEIDEVVAVLQSGWLTTGARVQQFEREFADYVNAPHAVAVNSCTAAMHVVLAAWGIGPGDEVITTPITFCATIEAIEYVGATPVLVDIDPQTGNIDPNLIERAITPNTKVVIPVHLAGLPCDMDEIMALADGHGLKVMEDAAHAVGAEYKGRKIGNISHATAFSFYATKNLSTGEGGMITTHDEALAAKCRQLALHGISRDAWKRYTAAGSWFYQVETLGYKYNMPDLLAALGIWQLRKLDAMNERRRQIADQYHRAFAEMPFIDLFPRHMPTDRTHPWHLYIALIKERRDEFAEAMKNRNIGISVHFIPIHYHPHYERYGWQRGDYPHAEAYFAQALSLPLYPGMTDDDIEDVIAAVWQVGQELA